MKRDATKVIWRTVVFAGAMLGAPACSKKHPTTMPTNTAKPAETTTTTTTTPPATDTKPTNGADPCAGADPARPRGADDDGGGGMGRGFVLS